MASIRARGGNGVALSASSRLVTGVSAWPLAAASAWRKLGSGGNQRQSSAGGVFQCGWLKTARCVIKWQK